MMKMKSHDDDVIDGLIQSCAAATGKAVSSAVVTVSDEAPG